MKIRGWIPGLVGVVLGVGVIGSAGLHMNARLAPDPSRPVLYLSGTCGASNALADDEEAMDSARKRGWRVVEVDGVESSSLMACARALGLGPLGAKLCAANSARASVEHHAAFPGGPVPAVALPGGQSLVGLAEIRELLASPLTEHGGSERR